MLNKKYDVNKFQKNIFLSILTYLSLNMNLNVQEAKGNPFYVSFVNIISSFEEFSVSRLILLPGLFLLFTFIYNKVPTRYRRKWFVIVPAFLFSFFLIIGNAYSKTGNWKILLTIYNGQLVKSIFIVLGYTVLFVYLISYFFYFLDNYIQGCNKKNIRKENEFFYFRLLSQRPFLTIFFTLSFFYLPNLLLSFPGKLMGDSNLQISQAFPELIDLGVNFDSWLQKYNIKYEGITALNNHHPVAHTMIIHFCLVLGEKLFHSYNIGVFIYTLLQNFIFIAAISFAFTILYKSDLRIKNYIPLIIVYFIIHPFIHIISPLMTKDVFYSSFVLLLGCSIYLYIKKIKSKWLLFAHIFGIGGMILFRNEGRFILYMSFAVIALFSKKLRKYSFISLLGTILISLFVFHILFPAMNVLPGSKREMLSIPFQQTARYVKYYDAEVTDFEREVINKVISYDDLSEQYNPNNSDPIKILYRDNVTTIDLLAYFKVWWQLIMKHPGMCLQASIHNYYQYVYPGAESQITYHYTFKWSEDRMKVINNNLKLLNGSIFYPNETKTYRTLIDDFMKNLIKVPLFSMLLTPAVYSWLLLLFIFYSFYRKNKTMFSMLIIPTFIFLILFTGPCNGYYGRYSTPLITTLPFYLPFSISCLLDNNYEE